VGTPDTQLAVVKEDKQVVDENMEGKKFDNGMMVETDVKDPPILNWYNLIGEAEIDYEINDEDDKEDDRETNDEFNARILKYCDVIVEYIGNTYSQLLFNQYESDNDIFEVLMANLSKSMYETLESTHQGIKELADNDLNNIAKKFAETGVKVAGLKTDEGPSTVFETPYKLTPGSDRSESQGILYVESKKTSGDELPTSVSLNESGKTVFEFDTPSTAATQLKGSPIQQPAVVTLKRPTKRGLETADTKVSTLPTIVSATDASEVQRAKTAKTERPFDNLEEEKGGSRLNKHRSKNRTKRVSYIKHKQTRKNQHSRKTK